MPRDESFSSQLEGIVHLPEELQRTWNWNDWAYNIDSSLIVKKADPQQHIPLFSFSGILFPRSSLRQEWPDILFQVSDDLLNW